MPTGLVNLGLPILNYFNHLKKSSPVQLDDNDAHGVAILEDFELMCNEFLESVSNRVCLIGV